jgi:hypothetical protein
MKRLFLPLLFLSASCSALLGQDLSTDIQAMKASYAGSGSIVMLDDGTISIQPKMPAPLCAMPKNEDGKTTWLYYTFPLSSIRVPLTEVDETLILEDRVFTSLDATKAYKPGDVGDTTMIVVSSKPGKQFHTLMYDLEKFLHLGPGPHSSSDYGQAPDDTQAFGLTFADPAAAHSFEVALKEAVILAKAQAAQAAQTARP